MKKITKPETKEECVYYSDFSGKSFGDLACPPVELELTFNYGSRNDGAHLSLHLDDQDAEQILTLLKQSVSEDFKAQIRKKLTNLSLSFEQSMQMRDWDSCDILTNDMWFLRRFLDMPDEE